MNLCLLTRADTVRRAGEAIVPRGGDGMMTLRAGEWLAPLGQGFFSCTRGS